MRRLEELAEIGMEVARALKQRVLDEAVQAADAARPAETTLGLAFARVARAVRQTLALEDRLDQARRAREQSPEAERAAWLADLTQSPGIAALRVAIHRNEVRAKVEQAICAEADGSDAERLLADLAERLDDDEACDDFTDRPIGVLVAAICRDLGLTPDWSAWENEDWAMDEAETKPPGSPYARPRTLARRFGAGWPDATWPDDDPWRRGPAGESHPP